jgi:hypothetical protein
VVNAAEGLGLGLFEWLGEALADGLAEAEGLAEADGLGVGLILLDVELDGLLLMLADGDCDNEGDLLPDTKPSSTRAWPQLNESTNFLTSKLDPNLKEPDGPLSS